MRYARYSESPSGAAARYWLAAGQVIFYAILEVARHEKTEKYKPTPFKAKDSTYSKEAADYAVGFIECLCHTKGTWAGKPFELIDWQEQIIQR